MPETPPARRTLWQGRLGASMSERVLAYTSSIDIDMRLAPDDAEASLAHAAMLHAVGLLDAGDHAAIEQGLRAIAAELDAGRFAVADSDEDVHSAVERRLHELIGEPALRLHTGRSRNDQVATDLRLFTRRGIDALTAAMDTLRATLVRLAHEHTATRMPGYTHLQRAQPVTLSLHLLAYDAMLERDAARLAQARERVDVLPLGSGALAGSTLPLDREIVRQRLGFAALTGNSMDAVSDRDFAAEVVFDAALLMVHLSRLCEDIIIWSTTEFGFLTLDDAHATGSSMMPQKKNPDVAELGRGRAARVVGDVVTLLTLLKGLPLTYDRDLQEDKRPLFDALDTAQATVEVLDELLGGARFNIDAMALAAADPALRATAVAEYLVSRGVPFREAHRVVAEMVRRTEMEGRSLDSVTLEEWQRSCPAADADILAILGPRRRS